MPTVRLWLLLCWLVAALSAAQGPPEKTAPQEPFLPVRDENACPFEGCTFRKWIVTRDSTIFSSWEDDRKPLFILKKGEVVAGLTGVHITYAPDRIQVLKPIPELGLEPRDIILRYMYRGEGFADIWVKGEWKKQYDCSFITEKDGSGCARDCLAKVTSEGRKDWWVRLKTARGATGWAKAEGQFDCMDSLGAAPSATISTNIWRTCLYREIIPIAARQVSGTRKLSAPQPKTAPTPGNLGIESLHPLNSSSCAGQIGL